MQNLLFEHCVIKVYCIFYPHLTHLKSLQKRKINTKNSKLPTLVYSFTIFFFTLGMFLYALDMDEDVISSHYSLAI